MSPVSAVCVQARKFDSWIAEDRNERDIGNTNQEPGTVLPALRFAKSQDAPPVALPKRTEGSQTTSRNH